VDFTAHCVMKWAVFLLSLRDDVHAVNCERIMNSRQSCDNAQRHTEWLR
jgi:hypothetical protein